MINMAQPPLGCPRTSCAPPRTARLERAELAAGAEGRRASTTTAALAADLAAELTDAGQDRSLGQRRRSGGGWTAAGQPCYELPLLPDGMDLGGLYRLAAALREQGAA